MTTPLTRPRTGGLTVAGVVTLATAGPPRTQTPASPSLTAIVSGGKRTNMMNWDTGDLCEVLTPDRTHVLITSAVT